LICSNQREDLRKTVGRAEDRLASREGASLSILRDSKSDFERWI
jgi:hypothetical protein